MRTLTLLALFILIACIHSAGQYPSAIKSPKDTTEIKKLISESFKLWNTNPQKGIQLADIALKACGDKSFKKGEALAYRSLAVCYWSQGSYAPALDASFKGVKIAQELKDDHTLSVLEHNLALIFGDLGDLDQAIYYFKRYIELNIKSDSLDNLAGAYNNLGYYFSKKNLIDSSIIYYQKALKLSEGKDVVKDAQYLYSSLSEAHFAKQDYEKAFEFNTKAYQIYKDLNETIGLVESYTMFAQLAIIQKNYSEAKRNLDRAQQLAHQGNFGYHFIPIYKLLSSIDSAQGNHRRALAYFKQAVHLHDSLNTINQKQAFDRMMMQYRADQQEKENLLLKKSNEIIKSDAETQRYKLIATLVVVVALFVVVVLYSVTRHAYSKRMNQIKIQQQIEAEKVRIANDLHDNIGSQLAVLSLDVNMLAKKNQLGTSVYMQLSESIHATINELRDTIWAMNKEVISADQLMDKINSLCWRFRKSTDQFRFNVSDRFDNQNIILNPNQGLNTFRIVQESISNSIKHSKGTQVDITAQIAGDKMVIEVRDNGSGFESAIASASDQVGLINMRSRAEKMGGHLLINSTANGTSIILELSLHQ